MPVINPKTYQPKPQRRRHNRWPLILLVGLILASAANYSRPLPAAQVQFVPPVLPAVRSPNLPWPIAGQAAVGAEGYGVLDTFGAQNPIATASIAKVITALCVLQEQPLEPGQMGPSYTIGQPDMDIYNAYIDAEGSVVPVAPGEVMNERQALEALLLPSANNIADSLANWVFKGQPNYATYAQQYLTKHNITHTTIGSDASGFDPSTTSTSSDLVQLGLLALGNPTLMSIAGEKTAELPVIGTVHNYDTVLGINGISGLKTGNSQRNPGAFLFTADTQVGSQRVRTAGVVLGLPDLEQALQAASNLAGAMGGGFTDKPVLPAGTKTGSIRTAWGATSDLTTAKPLTFRRWLATPLTQRHTLHALQGAVPQTAGTLEIRAVDNGTTTQLQTRTPVARPSFWWRLTRH